MATNDKATPMPVGTAANTTTYLANSSPPLARTPDYSKLCPIRVVDRDGTPHCWGERCAAFRPLNGTHGVCLLIERG